MDASRRDTGLSLAVHDQHRDIYDSTDQRGATSDLTVRGVSGWLDRGCVGEPHALSRLLDAVRADASDQLQDIFQRLIDELDGQGRAIPGSGLGELGDPRCKRCRGAHGDYLLPRQVGIAAGAYNDERWWEGTTAQGWQHGEGTTEGPSSNGAKTGSSCMTIRSASKLCFG
ncbi:hypothetical protein [Candidatus Accumulibacter sp. ACC003]|uniref:hypothetical protein n=1 Tax=Candidatus Accumulibacter sp. ACC003 TaxID=2823334 RepID=UPI0025B8303A|nr:hypothetical protein [Candidatus Accumulibacter sp. ACC003]